MKVQDFADKTPVLKPEAFFIGSFDGWGVLEGPAGGLHGRYTISAEGRLLSTGDIRFVETWSFDNGHVDTLNWTIKPHGDGAYTGEEDCLEGEAKGEQSGCAFHWTYTRDTPQPGGGSAKLHFNDWFWRIDEMVMVVKGSASKLGLPFASAHVTYRKSA